MKPTDAPSPLTIATRRYDYKPMAAFFNAFHLRAFCTARVELTSPVLDIGCSDGEFALLLSELLGPPESMSGVDISPRAIASAGERAAALYDQMQVASGSQLPFEDQSFQTVVVNASLTSIQPGLDETLREAFRVLKPGGTFYASVCTDQYEHHYWLSRLFSRCGMPGVARRYRNAMNRRMQQAHLLSPDAWIERVERSGLRVTDRFGFMPLSLVPLWSFLAWTPLRVHGLLKYIPSPRLHRAAANGYRRWFSRGYDRTPSRLDLSESGYLFLSAVKED